MRAIDVSFLTLLLSIFSGCGGERHEPGVPLALFESLRPSVTGIDFENTLHYTEQLNTYTFRSFYNGGGVGIGDFNKDGLSDIFFSGNLVSNKLYLNEGRFRFRDISGEAGIAGNHTWTTGVTVADINGDGWLDLYLCKSGPPGDEGRHNELFINNGNLTFTESAEAYGLDFEGLAVHASFFDYDKDGDLDCYLLNNSMRSIGIYDLRKDQRKIDDPHGGNRLLRNDEGRFVDVSRTAGIYTSAIGFGLGVTVGDVNKDGWIDLYVSNDFFERDYLYINQKDGSFRECLEEYMREISLGSMGADMADVNNDGWAEIFVTEMLPESDHRLKTTTQFESWDKYAHAVEQGYYHQFSRNVLQLNNGDGSFSEISRLAGVEATDWSWGALIFDMDNDGWKDIFVANGIFKDLLDQDYVNFASDHNVVRRILQRKGAVIKQLIDSIPSNKIANFAFRNTGGLQFTDNTEEWGLNDPTHSNGSAYADLDNDGDLDLVLNNANMPAGVYRNYADTLSDHNFVAVALSGEGKNTFGVGAKITIKAAGHTFYQENFPARGFMSSVDQRVYFGLGNIETIDTLMVEWPDDRITLLTKLPANQILELQQKEAVRLSGTTIASPAGSIFSRMDVAEPFRHVENDYVDFDRDRLLFHMVSNEGPCLCISDVNDDGRDDYYVGGAKGQAGGLFFQQRDGKFVKAPSDVFESDKESEDTDCIFFDANGDGKPDLYVTSGGNEFSAFSPALADRLYFKQGGGRYERSRQILPVSTRFESTSTVRACDFDADGDQDLFVGAGLIPGLYGLPASGYLLANDGKGRFTDVTPSMAPELIDIGLITDAQWTDINRDSIPDLVVVGQWMPVEIFLNNGRKLIRDSAAGFDMSNGWYNCIEAADFNHDGYIDLVFGNHGLNSRFKASQSEPVRLYINDFDQNGAVEHITTRYYRGTALPLVLRQDLVMQIPSLKKKYLLYESYAGETVSDIFTPGELAHAITLSAYRLETSVWLGRGDGTFLESALPLQAQFTPVYSIFVDDIDGDSNLDMVLGGNLYRAKPETGIYDASYGVVLRGDGKGGFSPVSSSHSGLHVKGEVREMKKMSKPSRRLVIGKNNDTVEFFQY